MIPSDCKFTDSHEWAKKSGKTVKVGVTDHAQKELGDIVYVDLPEVGADVKKGDEALEVESVKAVAHVVAPVSGKIVAVNEALEDDPALINSDCYNGGWIFEIEMTNPGEYDALMSSDDYEKILD